MKIREFAEKYALYYHEVYTAMSFTNKLRRHESDVDYPETVIFEAMLTYLNNREEKYLQTADEYTKKINKLLSEGKNE